MSKKIKILWLSCFLFLFLFVGCEGTQQQGTLEVSFADKGLSRSLFAPAISMEVASYEISGQGPEAHSFEGITSNGESVSVPQLHMGAWTVTVTGFNAEGTAIGEGVAVVSITPGRTTRASIQVTAFSGEGSFSFDANWPASEVSAPQLKLTLTRTDDQTSQDLAPTIDAVAGTAAYSGQLAAGYYTLLAELYDGPSTESANRLYGTVHVVRIVAGNATQGSMTIEQSSLNLEGSLAVTVENGIGDPFAVRLARSAEQVGEGRNLTVTATAVPDVDCTYAWYVDGILLGETGNEVSIGAGLSLGYHCVDVVATFSGNVASASTSITVTEDATGYLSYVLTSLDDPTVTYTGRLEAGFEGDLSYLG